MSVIGALTLTEQQQTFVEKIKARVTDQLNLEVDFSQLEANAVDFSKINDMAINSMDETLGRQISVPLKTAEGMDGELSYSEVNGSWLSHVATKTKKADVLKKFRNTAYSNNNFKKLSNYIVEKGYILKPNEEYIIQNAKYLKDEKENKTLTHNSDMFVVPIYKNDVPVGMLAIDDTQKTPVIGIDNERTFINEEDGEIITIMADACSLSWIQCMADCLPGCDSWQGCLMFFGSCLVFCCGCLSVVSCIMCGACLFIGGYCLWTCRMCVYGSARPWECDY